MRIVFFGDSLTWGGYGGNYVDEVARLLPDHEIVNAGNGGDTVLSLLNRLDEDVLSLNPDGVFVMIGGNDAISFSQPATRTYYRRGERAPGGVVTLDLFTRSYRDLLTRIQLAHSLAWVGLEPNEYNPDTLYAQRLFNDAAREVAESLNVPVIDFMAAFPPLGVKDRPPLDLATIRLIGERSDGVWNDYEKERAAGGYTWSFDGMHITPETAQRMARLIVDFLAL